MDTTIANPTPVKVIGRASECMRRLMEEGLTYEALQMPIDDPKMRERLVRFWLSDAFHPSVSQREARLIMGKNFLGVEEAIRLFKVRPSKKELEALGRIPFTQEELQQVKDTHLLVAVFSLSLLQVKERARDLFYSQDWYNSEKFVQDKGGKPFWALVRKDIVPDSMVKTWDQQQALLSKDEEVPTARVMVYTTILYYLATGERLFSSIYVRCKDLSSGGRRVNVGNFDSNGLNVNNYWDDNVNSNIGLASARNFFLYLTETLSFRKRLI